MKIRMTAAERLAQQERKRLAQELAQKERKPVKSLPQQSQPPQGGATTKLTSESRPVITLPPVPVVEWHGCYDEGWRDAITPESFAHPAKAGRALLRRIFDHLFAVGALTQRQSVVVDPFAGIFTTGIEGASRGVQVVGCELEEKFYKLAQANIALHEHGWRQMNYPIPAIVHGDSRQLRRHIQPSVDAIISSPPYAELGANIKGHGIIGAGVSKDPKYGQAEYGQSEGQLGAMKEGSVDAIVSSPPFGTGDSASAQSIANRTDKSAQWVKRNTGSAATEGYGATDGQLAEMESGSVDAVISSPPYVAPPGHDTGHPRLDATEDARRANEGSARRSGYGQSEDNIAHLKEGQVDAVIGSPPYAEGLGHGGTPTTGGGKAGDVSLDAMQQGYGNSDGQLGKMKDDGVDIIVSSPPYTGDGVDVVVSSPPYAEIATGAGGLNTKPGVEGQQSGRSANSASQDTDQRYGDTAGQLARMTKGEVDVVVSSPPYADQPMDPGDASRPEAKIARLIAEGRLEETEKIRRHFSGSANNLRQHEYGESDGQLSRMDTGSVDAIVSSPPYADGGVHGHSNDIDQDEQQRANKAISGIGVSSVTGYGTSPGQLGALKEEGIDAVVTDGRKALPQGREGYGTTPGQIGAESGDTFWTAARDIVRECHAILKPGGYAVWIVKAFIRNRQIVDFPGDWRKLCEYCGFETELEVHAMLVKSQTQRVWAEDGSEQTVVEKKERKSFFRRLVESKGSPQINYEVVYVMRKRVQ